MKWQTKTRVKYEDLPRECKKEICNGCGGKGGWVKPPHRIFFKTSCNHHDYGYACGGTEEDRKQGDLMLLNFMFYDCSFLPWWRKVRYLPWCFVYYFSVRAFGGKYFYYGTKRWPLFVQTHKLIRDIYIRGVCVHFCDIFYIKLCKKMGLLQNLGFGLQV